MAVTSPTVGEGTFLTNGTLLVEVRSVTETTVIVEDARGQVGVPDLDSIPLSDLASGKWRVVGV